MKSVLLALSLFFSVNVLAQQTNYVWDFHQSEVPFVKLGPNCTPGNASHCPMSGGAKFCDIDMEFYATHGCPEVHALQDDGDGYFDLDAHNFSGTPHGEGFVIKNNWKANYTYRISILGGSIFDENATLQVGFTNNPVYDPTPNNLCSDLIAGVVDISALTSPMATMVNPNTTVTLTLTECKQYLWFSSIPEASINGGGIAFRILLIEEIPAQINGSESLCSGTANYNLQGLSPTASVSWSVDPPGNSIATIPSPSAGSSVTLTKTGTGFVTLKATVSDNCISSYSYTVSKKIMVGAAIEGYYTISSSYYCCPGYQNPLGPNNSFWLPPNQIASVQVNITNPVQSITWSRSGYPFSWSQCCDGKTLNFVGSSGSTAYSSRTATFQANAQTTCGTGISSYNFTVMTQGWSGFQKADQVESKVDASPSASAAIRVFPSPAEDNIYINLSSGKQYTVRLTNAAGNRVYEEKKSTSYVLSVSKYPRGIYYVTIITSRGQKPFVQKLVLK